MFNSNKLKKNHRWPFFDERVHHFKEVSGKDMSIERLHEILETDVSYFSIDLVLSKHMNTTITNNTSKSYKWKKMKGCFNTNGEQLYAWMYKIGNEEFKNIEFGTIQDFKTIVSKNINNITSEL